jgi:hypothetical protein
VCNSIHDACLCVSDTNCSSGTCVASAGSCDAGACTGAGSPDVTGCASLLATPR